MRMILDTDPGNGVPGADVDDGLAIGLALRSPEIELEAITVVAGNVSVDRGVRSALEVLEVAGATHVPVHRGAARPLMQDPTAWRARLDGRRDSESARRHWQHLRTPGATTAADPTPAARVLVDRVNERPGEITVLAIGPLTNIATAMMLDPEWSQKIKQLVVMGGAFDVPNLLHELNAAYDPEATHIVLSSGAPLLIVPLDVTTRTFMRLGDVDRLDAAGTPLATYLGHTARPWITWLAERFAEDGCALHDPLALAALLEPRVIGTRTAYVDVELRGRLTRGRMVAWDDEMLRGDLELPELSPVMIADHVDNDLFMPLLLDRLTS
ncbi:nucleoside hydrolase [Saccharothrix coeruleofusca]|uniref:Hydrolase n=1 Tax=Saccharothrix coeruleofusca TaxID=33919 RepID=A0A918ASP0_9PSEU|nr:nucleoside hydrolase [Saccharothrix coeruleofusca]MBP2336753.1 inosine-uridine nucleoside N-ribohydrolase [Saccharothrix coeruleofusca]GGP78292.1 hydrolase [Saccharothrix coeruleofusca]